MANKARNTGNTEVKTKLYSASDIKVRIAVVNPRDQFVVNTVLGKIIRLNDNEMTMVVWEKHLGKHLSGVNYKIVKK